MHTKKQQYELLFRLLCKMTFIVATSQHAFFGLLRAKGAKRRT